MSIVDQMVAVEDALIEERNRLFAEAAAFEAMRLGQCAAAAAVTGLLPAFLIGFDRFCQLADVVEAETRRDALLTAIESVETAVSRLPRIIDLTSADPDRAARAAESMMAVVVAVRGISGIDDFVADAVELARGIVEDTGDLAKGNALGFVVGAVVAVGALVLLSGRR